jgi:WD40 repeat protein
MNSIRNLSSTIITGDIIKEFPKAHDKFITALQVSPDGKALATGSRDTTIGVWA